MRFTLFTPVFNRAHTLDRVWRSIRSQSFRDFEWIAVDDGSTDGSLAQLEEYRRTANFPMTVIRSAENRGKHVAWNAAVGVARGELFVPCDADDEFDPDALERFAQTWAQLTDDERASASGINVLCRDAQTSKIVGTAFPSSPMWSNNLDLFYRHRVTGEKWGCIRADLLRTLRFPETPGYFGESRLWYALARTHRVLCLNVPLRTYFRDQPGSLTAGTPRRERLPAMFEYAVWHLRENWDCIRLRPVRALGEGSNVFMRGYLIGKTTAEINAKLAGTAARKFSPVFAVIGAVRAWRIRRVWSVARQT